jgi:hypothetical protein
LILVNMASWRRSEGLVSLSNVKAIRAINLAGALDYARDFLTLGQGSDAQTLILGSRTSFSPTAEWALIMTLMILIVAAGVRTLANRWLQLAALCAVSYVGIGVGLFLLPQETGIHHWILSTPFQYAAIALALPGFAGLSRSGTAFVLAGVIALIAVRAPNIIAVERALLNGESSEIFSPEFTRLAELAAGKSDDAIFVSGDWGTGTQLYCAMNGKLASVYEPFWNTNPGAAVLDIAGTTTKPSIYVFVTGVAPQFAPASEVIIEALASAPAWKESPVETEFSQLTRIRVRKFVRR